MFRLNSEFRLNKKKEPGNTSTQIINLPNKIVRINKSNKAPALVINLETSQNMNIKTAIIVPRME